VVAYVAGRASHAGRVSGDKTNSVALVREQARQKKYPGPPDWGSEHGAVMIVPVKSISR
jgi:hypothetical protein